MYLGVWGFCWCWPCASRWKDDGKARGKNEERKLGSLRKEEGRTRAVQRPVARNVSHVHHEVGPLLLMGIYRFGFWTHSLAECIFGCLAPSARLFKTSRLSRNQNQSEHYKSNTLSTRHASAGLYSICPNEQEWENQPRDVIRQQSRTYGSGRSCFYGSSTTSSFQVKRALPGHGVNPITSVMAYVRACPPLFPHFPFSLPNIRPLCGLFSSAHADKSLRSHNITNLPLPTFLSFSRRFLTVRSCRSGDCCT